MNRRLNERKPWSALKRDSEVKKIQRVDERVLYFAGLNRT